MPGYDTRFGLDRLACPDSVPCDTGSVDFSRAAPLDFPLLFSLFTLFSELRSYFALQAESLSSQASTPKFQFVINILGRPFQGGAP